METDQKEPRLPRGKCVALALASKALGVKSTVQTYHDFCTEFTRARHGRNVLCAGDRARKRPIWRYVDVYWNSSQLQVIQNEHRYSNLIVEYIWVGKDHGRSSQLRAGSRIPKPSGGGRSSIMGGAPSSPGIEIAS